jgi:uncharacterized membrane protein YidH (DUF202 family)
MSTTATTVSTTEVKVAQAPLPITLVGKVAIITGASRYYMSIFIHIDHMCIMTYLFICFFCVCVCVCVCVCCLLMYLK